MSLLHQSLSALKASPVSAIPLSELQAHYRNIALGFNKKFSEFAVSICGCVSPSDRVKLKKSVWFQTTGLRLRAFETDSTRPGLKILAQMECPVQILPKSSSAARDECSPSKIILASKLLRSHFDLNESATCRGCSKRGRCPFARQVVANKSTKTSLGALAKTLYGMSQSCRLYLKDPEVYPFVLSAAEVEAAVALTEDLTKFLEPSAIERQLRNVPVADRNAVRAIVKHQLKKNQELESERQKRKKDGIAEWMDQAVIEEGPSTSKNDNSVSKFDIDSEDWVPEEKQEELMKSNLKFPDISSPKVSSNVTSIDSITDTPIPERFAKSFEKLVRRKPVKPRPTMSISQDPHQPTGGYEIGTPLTPKGGIEYIKPDFLKGKTVLDNVSLASKLWTGASPHITELKFLQRVPFEDRVHDTSPRVDPVLAKVLAKQPTETEETDIKPPVTSEEDRFGMWKQRRAVKVALIDKRIDVQGMRGNESVDLAGMDIASLPCGNVSLSKREIHMVGNTEALRAATGGTGAKGSELRFPKLPQWNPKPPVQQRTDPLSSKTDISKLMRPPPLSAQAEQLRSVKALRRVAQKRKADTKVQFTTPAEAAKVWKINHS